jgi:hypothetical protein
MDITSITGEGEVAGFCEQGDELLSFIKHVEFFDCLRNSGFLKKDHAVWSE